MSARVESVQRTGARLRGITALVTDVDADMGRAIALAQRLAGRRIRVNTIVPGDGPAPPLPSLK